MKRLIAKKDREDDEFLGAYIEIIYPKSKFIGFRGWIDEHYNKDRYKIMLEPAAYEHTEKWHIFYVHTDEIWKWVRIVPIEIEGN